MLTSFSDTERIVDALDAGAVGYLLKDTDPEELLEAVRSVVPRRLAAAPAGRPAAAHRPDPGRSAERDLTAREREVLELVRQGLANKQIARRLGISERTVKAHLTSVFNSIGVTDRTGAALWAQRHRDQQLPDPRATRRRQSPPSPLPTRTTPRTSSSTLITAALLCWSQTRSSSSGPRSRSLATR